MNNVVQTRKLLRDRTVGARKVFKSELVELDTPDGKIVLELRMPSVAGRQAILDKATKKDGGVDTVKHFVQVLLALVYVPAEDGEGKPVPGVSDTLLFEEADAESLAAQPEGSWVTELGHRAFGFLRSRAEEVGKGSATIPASAS